jgi:beta-lactam-binding protein with PASTA domain
MSNPIIESGTIATNAGAGNTRTATLTTTLSNLAVVTIHSELQVAVQPIVASVVSAGLTWTKVYTINGGSGPFSTGVAIEVWYAILSGPYSDAVTVTYQNPPGTDNGAIVLFGVENASPITPFDTNASLPGNAWSGTSPNDAIVSGVNTVNADTLVLALYANSQPVQMSPPVTDYAVVAQVTTAAGSAWMYASVFSWNPNAALSGYTLDSGIGSIAPLLGLAVINGFTPTTMVPVVVGQSLVTGENAIAAASLVVGTVTGTYDPSVPLGDIISTSPAGGTIVAIGSTVDVIYSTLGTTTVPDLTNTSVLVVAPGLLAAASLILGAVTYAPSGTVIAGNVISQTPAGGDTVTIGSAVNVVVSSGLPPLTVPDLFGLDQTDAVNLLLSLGLVPGAVGSAPSQFVPPGEVQAQNPSAGIAVAVGTIVSFVLSQGTPVAGTLFDFEATVISQYANSPTILQLCNNMNQYVDQSQNFANFFNFVWNVDTAVGFGLDIWGTIVGVGRLLQIPNSTVYVGFYQSGESQPDQDWTPAGSSQPPYNDPPVGGAFYTGNNATEAYLLPDDAYRQLILAKAFANIASTTAPALNQILQNLYGPGAAFVLNTGPMAISYNLTFTPTAIQLAILEQSGVIPTPPGVSVVINTNV